MTVNEEFQFESRRFRGYDAGPHLLITAGVHGDEFLPMLAVRGLIRRFDSCDDLLGRLRGTLTLVPVANRSAFQLGRRVGSDGKDLARTFPGCSDGTITERVAHDLSRMIREANYYIDLHTGGTELCVWPLAGYMLHNDSEVLDQQRSMAQAFGLPFVWGTSANLNGRSLSVARDAAIPAIYVEYFGAHRELSEAATGIMRNPDSEHPLVAGCFDVMKHFDMLDGPRSPCLGQAICEDWRSDSGHMQVSHPATASGFLVPMVELGQCISNGDPLAEITSITGGEKHVIVSQQQGRVIVLREYPRINKGDSVAVVAESSPKHRQVHITKITEGELQ